MKYIYYPEFELERRGMLPKNKHPDHILNIKLLMFLCDYVILPLSHLLYASSENIISLKNNLQMFFDEGKIVTTWYQSGIEGYFNSRLERIQDPIDKATLTLRAGLIKNELFTNSNAEHNKINEKEQLGLFDIRIRELINDSTVFKKESRLLIERMNEISYKSGEPVHSRQFGNALTDMYDDKVINARGKKFFSNLMSNAYYYSGTITMGSLVAYNEYFKQINLQDSLLQIHNGATNLIINPYFLCNLFKTIGIDTRDIYRLGVSDYKEIMNHKYWKSFLSIFEHIYTDAQELDYLLADRKILNEVYKKRKLGINKFEDWFGDLLLGIPLLNIDPTLGLGITLVCSFLRKFVPPIEQLNKCVNDNVSDKILFLMNRGQDPLYEFYYRLNTVIQKLK